MVSSAKPTGCADAAIGEQLDGTLASLDLLEALLLERFADVESTRT